MSITSKLLGLAVRAAENDAEKAVAKTAGREVRRGGAKDIPLAVNRQTPKATLNIGLKPSDKIGGPPIKRSAVVAAIKATGRKPKNLAVVASDTEPTLVADVHPPLSADEAHSLSVKLRQDAIAQHLGGGLGDLHGPDAADWGDFNPDYFYTQSGDRLGNTLAVDRKYTRPAAVAMTPRIEDRKGEMQRLGDMVLETTPKADDVKPLSIFDLEGKTGITSMSDLSAAGDAVTGVNGVGLTEPVDRMGGQDYMHHSPAAWAAARGSAENHMELARAMRTETGQDPLFLPWTMGPRSIDFSHMPRELMLRYAAETLGARDRGALDKAIAALVPGYSSMVDPASVQAFRSVAGQPRFELNNLLDRYRDKTGMGLGLGAARLAMTDLDQIGTAPTTLRNVGLLEANAPLSASAHPSYNTAIPGGGLGRLMERVSALDFLPDIMEQAGLTDPFNLPVVAPKGGKAPRRMLEMAPKGFTITEKALRAIEKRNRKP